MTKRTQGWLAIKRDLPGNIVAVQYVVRLEHHRGLNPGAPINDTHDFIEIGASAIIEAERLCAARRLFYDRRNEIQLERSPWGPIGKQGKSPPIIEPNT